jgi:hypothetical protein
MARKNTSFWKQKNGGKMFNPCQNSNPYYPNRISGNDVKSLAQADFKEELLQLLFNPDKRTSDNAAWVMSHKLFSHPPSQQAEASTLILCHNHFMPAKLLKIHQTRSKIYPPRPQIN